MFHKDEDFEAFERVIAEGFDRYPVDLLTYCLMGNHWHLVLRPRRDEALSRFMRWIGVTHVRRHHQHYRTPGGMMQSEGLLGGDGFTGETPVPQGPPIFGDPEAYESAWAEYYAWMWEASVPHGGSYVLVPGVGPGAPGGPTPQLRCAPRQMSRCGFASCGARRCRQCGWSQQRHG